MKEDIENTGRKYFFLRIATVVVIALAVMIFIIPGRDSTSPTFLYGLVIVIALSFAYGISARFMKRGETGKTEHGNPYHNFFFRGTAVLTMVLTLLGILGAIFIYADDGNLFQSVGLVISVIWIGAFLMYFMWAVYHYNINYGLTDLDWEKIFEARERYRQGFPVKQTELDAPTSNPYRAQTFGLPPGTVRGMIAFTLLIGGMSLLIVSFGTEYTGAELALVRQQFEFFETAFLMMIAFYFGDKSLRYLGNRWSRANPSSPQPEAEDDTAQNEGPMGTPGLPKLPGPKDPVYREDQILLEEDQQFTERNDVEPPPAKHPDVTIQQPLSAYQPFNKEIEYVQIMDNLHQRVLSDEDIKIALDDLKNEDGITLSFPVVKAVISVESAGRGHLQDGRAKILFEGHKFWYWLEKFGKNPEELHEKHPTIVYKNWTSQNYLKGAAEYKRLEEAKKIDPKAAIYSASWGLFQILGENLEHHIKSRNYKDAFDFEEKQHKSEYYHFLDFLAFIKTKKVREKELIHYISEETNGNYDWDSFAYGYNGSGYKVNKYDVRLQAAYEKFKKEATGDVPGWIPIIDAGHGGLVDGQYSTEGKQYRFSDGTVIYEGVINRAIGRLLAKKLTENNIPYLHTTLETEANIGLMERVQQANAFFQLKPNCYVLSIHCNASSDETEGEGKAGKGFEIYTSIGKTKSDELAHIASKWYKRLFPEFEFRENKTEGGEYKNKEASFVMLTKTKGPAFIVENLFYDNKEEALFLLSEDGQNRIAECLFQAVKEIYQKVGP